MENDCADLQKLIKIETLGFELKHNKMLKKAEELN